MSELDGLFDDASEADLLQAGLERAVFEDGLADRPGTLRTYILLDAAAAPEIAVCLDGFSAPAVCLFDGKARDDLGDVAPWLVEADPRTAAWSWFVEHGYGNNWGVLLQSRTDMRRLKASLKRFIEVRNPDGENVFFKYYRPRNLNATLPGFTDAQVAAFFRDLDAVFAESHGQPEVLLRYALSGDGGLSRETLNLSALGASPSTADPASAGGDTLQPGA